MTESAWGVVAELVEDVTYAILSSTPVSTHTAPADHRLDIDPKRGHLPVENSGRGAGRGRQEGVDGLSLERRRIERKKKVPSF
jgi:hypothetical protein